MQRWTKKSYVSFEWCLIWPPRCWTLQVCQSSVYGRVWTAAWITPNLIMLVKRWVSGQQVTHTCWKRLMLSRMLNCCQRLEKFTLPSIKSGFPRWTNVKSCRIKPLSGKTKPTLLAKQSSITVMYISFTSDSCSFDFIEWAIF